METLFVARDAMLSRQDATLLVKRPGHPVRRVPIEGLRHIVLTGESGLTTSLLALCGRRSVRVTVLDWNGNAAGSFEPVGAPAAGRVRMAQASVADDPARRLVFARRFVEGAARNILANLRYRSYRGNTDMKPVIAFIEGWVGRLDEAADTAALMGMEGQIRAAYYEAWRSIHPSLDFLPRRRRPPNNPVNCLISWFNGLSYGLARNEIAKTHLDECLSFLHSPREARASLSLDLAEIFKPALGDVILFELALRDRIDEGWFVREEGVCRLSEKGREATLEEWIRRTETAREGDMTMREIVRAEAIAIERELLGLGKWKPWRRKV